MIENRISSRMSNCISLRLRESSTAQEEHRVTNPTMDINEKLQCVDILTSLRGVFWDKCMPQYIKGVSRTVLLSASPLLSLTGGGGKIRECHF